jgi:hypothetical protein
MTAAAVFEACLAVIGLVGLIGLALVGCMELLLPVPYDDEVIEGIHATTAAAEAAMYAVADQRPQGR